ncbi:peptidoglycan bridge formation glycyltransferase FemA/FemB family protein [Candidatus Saccharibacteria bacterium]|nr:peptidoglycan bridge formation glycyltransferase FemA/FemB family protein [Candidatus Saccharibacteria bacterium]MBH1973180.1 peptidoglycan bridge formation glycyltransferase FemA/FemB family protein [Candidatus Saccharibacteria bacterium]MBH1990579.1 peptidoglycan bridge formation glycyltransferase FemA/FemB family protein [Candidatus Saccharibacteria bacterium]
MILTQSVHDQEEWDNYILESQGHPLQLWGWGEVKAAHNWRVDRVFANKDDRIIGAAQLLVRTLPYPFRALVYIPRGPVVADERDRAEMLEALATYAKDTHNAVAMSVEPDWETMPKLDGWQQAANSILIPRTLILELSLSEDELQAAMSKKTRQYIRKSLSESIDIRRVKSREELQACLEIYKQTAERAGFAIHGDEYYLDIASKMKDYSPVFAAFLEGKPVAFLWLAISEQTAFELYGGMNDVGQQLRANYALKWHVIQTAKEWGIARYDMNGLLNDGVSTFKQGFASHEDMLAGTYDKPLSPLYGAWSRGLPLAKKIVRTLKTR